MEFVECRRHDTIFIEERIRLTVLDRVRDSVTLSVLADAGCNVRFAYADVCVEPVDTRHTRYLLPLLSGDCFTVDDIQVGVGLYLDRREIADNDDCDVQLQIRRLPEPQRSGAPAQAGGTHGVAPPAQTASPMRIRFLRADDAPERERGAPCSP